MTDALDCTSIDRVAQPHPRPELMTWLPWLPWPLLVIVCACPAHLRSVYRVYSLAEQDVQLRGVCSHQGACRLSRSQQIAWAWRGIGHGLVCISFTLPPARNRLSHASHTSNALNP